jgi:hypothetical protein
MFKTRYAANIGRRRALQIPGYATLADVGFDGDWVSPYQKSACSEDGIVLIAYNWLDEQSVAENRIILERLGYLPGILFNRVLDQALGLCGKSRRHFYVTQAFHLIPRTRSEGISSSAIDRSFDEVTKHEVAGRRVVAMGTAAGTACRRHGVHHVEVCHPSARGRTVLDKAREIASSFKSLE